MTRHQATRQPGPSRPDPNQPTAATKIGGTSTFSTHRKDWNAHRMRSFHRQCAGTRQAPPRPCSSAHGRSIPANARRPATTMADNKTSTIEPINRRSANITQGKSRAPNRSMYYAMGYVEGDFVKPMVGVANGHSSITPCNSGLQKLTDAAIEGIEEAGGNAQVFGTPTISDGMAMGTEGMKYSLVSREVISDCIETCVSGQWLDGVLVVGGCDKNMPGGLMGMLRAKVPGIYVYGGTILPGHYQGRELNIVSVFEAVGENAAGKLSDHDLREIEKRAIPGTGSCGGMYTANTMSSAFEALGISLPYSSTMANPHDEKTNSAKASAKVLIEAIRNDLKPRDIVTRKAIENAVAVIMATGGSTNAVLHFLAIAHAAGVPWSIDDFERARQKTPVLCDLKPSGKYLAVDLHRAGGIPQVMKRLLNAGLLHGDCITIEGKTMAQVLKDVPDRPRADQNVIRPIHQPLYPQRHLAILKRNPTPPPPPAPSRPGPPAHPQGQPPPRRGRGQDHRPEEPGHHRPGARVRRRAICAAGDTGRQDPGRRRDGAALPGAQGRPRHA